MVTDKIMVIEIGIIGILEAGTEMIEMTVETREMTVETAETIEETLLLPTKTYQTAATM